MCVYAGGGEGTLNSDLLGTANDIVTRSHHLRLNKHTSLSLKWMLNNLNIDAKYVIPALGSRRIIPSMANCFTVKPILMVFIA